MRMRKIIATLICSAAALSLVGCSGNSEHMLNEQKTSGGILGIFGDTDSLPVGIYDSRGGDITPGIPVIDESAFEYEVYDSDSVVITEYLGNFSEVNIPDTLDGEKSP